jgi:hypothetical protein
MRFFESSNLDVHAAHAQSLASRFETVRKAHFDTTVHNIEQVLGQVIPPEKRALGGEADLALMGYQLFTFIELMRAQGYVPQQNDQQDFREMLIKAAWETQREAVDEFCMQISQCGDDFIKQAAHVATPISLFLLGEPNPAACKIVGTLLPGFSIATQYAIAGEFGDKVTQIRLRNDLEGFRRYIEIMWPKSIDEL